ncbi:hypothetical protein JW848_11255 [Candidatus Bipolaricaulota bacterium]|nr:hypothetical protein [Candidatus Bipolaricaulota bacterium]
MTMLVGMYRADLNGDIILAADGCRALRKGSSEAWVEEESYEIKSVRLSETCAIAISASSLRFANWLLAHLYDKPAWRELGDAVSATRIIMADEARYLRDGYMLGDLNRDLCGFRLPSPKKKEEGSGLTVLVAGSRSDGRTGIELWRFTEASMKHCYAFVPVRYSVLDGKDEDSVEDCLVASADTEANLQQAFAMVAERYPGRVNANVGIRCLHEGFAFRWLNN